MTKICSSTDRKLGSGMSRIGPSSDGQWLGQRFCEVRARSLRLSASLSAEDQQIQGFEYASPTKWHLAHTTWFFETFVLTGACTTTPLVDPSYSVLFNSYYEGVGDQFSRPQRGLLSRPSLDAIHQYRSIVDHRVLELLATGNHPELWPIITLGLQHEEQHQELLLTDILANLSINPTYPAWRDFEPSLRTHDQTSGRPTTHLNHSIDHSEHGLDNTSHSEWINFDSGLFEIGYSGDGFAFDNEKPRHRSYLEPFALRSTLISNAEVMAFIDDNGYARPSLWLSDGIAWVRKYGITSPEYWHSDKDGQWQTFTLYGERPIVPDAPATHLSGYEADAIATWLGLRLPTEQEWESAALRRGGCPTTGRWLENGPVTPFRPVVQTGQFSGLWGETWEWTRSAYQPYPGFRPLSGAVGEYNGKFMANQWVLRGGSCATAPGHVRPTYRNFFYPHQRWQFTGLRPARDLA